MTLFSRLARHRASNCALAMTIESFMSQQQQRQRSYTAHNKIICWGAHLCVVYGFGIRMCRVYVRVSVCLRIYMLAQARAAVYIYVLISLSERHCLCGSQKKEHP